MGLTPSESIQLETMYMSKGQIWVGSIPPKAQIYTKIALLLNTQLGQRSSIGLMGAATDGWYGYIRYVSNNE